MVVIEKKLTICPTQAVAAKGARIVFFSGGTAFRASSQELMKYTENSTHIITTFDSGGSSAALRNAFAMPAIGDLRNRLTALMPVETLSQQKMHDFLEKRLSTQGDSASLQELFAILEQKDTLIADTNHKGIGTFFAWLALFVKNMPQDFSLKDASLGNLIMAGAYIDFEYDLHKVLRSMEEILAVKGHVCPSCVDNLHLHVLLENGEEFFAQHEFTGKNMPSIESSICKFCLCNEDREICKLPNASQEVIDAIASAELICFPMGSFYSSTLASLLSYGIAEAIAKNPCKKVFIPSTGIDPESYGLSVGVKTQRLINQLMDAYPKGKREDFLQAVFLDVQSEHYPQKIEENLLKSLGVDIFKLPLVSENLAPAIDAEKLIPELISYLNN